MSDAVESRLSLPQTLYSVKAETLRVQTCTREEAVRLLLRQGARESARLAQTLRSALALCCDHAQGGALILITKGEALKMVFHGVGRDPFAEPPDPFGAFGGSDGPRLRTSDGGYMTAALRGIHVSDARFAAAFRLFTEHSDTDRWPETHADPRARSQPKDGAFLLDPSGYRLKCAVKLLGLPPAIVWEGVGTKHEAGLAAAWEVEGCIALVRSDSGSVHGIVRDGSTLLAYRIQPDALELP